MIILLFFTVKLGDYIFNKGKDPDDYLISLTTSLADLASMSIMVVLIFFLV